MQSSQLFHPPHKLETTMKIISNTKKVNRYRKISQYTTLGSLVVLIGGFALSFNVEYIQYSFAALLVGLLLSQVGMYFTNRWGRSPRPDERITAGLKGLDDKYTLYNYTGPVPHLLVGPHGIWVLVPMYQGGKITFEGKKYRQAGVGVFSRLVGQESLGRPELEAQSYQEDMKRFLRKQLPDKTLPEVQAALVFTSPKASVDAQEAPFATLEVDKLKDFVRRRAKESPVRLEELRPLVEILPEESN
jgi:hypothetical protein